MPPFLKKIQYSFSFINKLRTPIQQTDPFIYNAIIGQKNRQSSGINLIASENYCSNACFAAVGSILNNKYSEGYPGSRYYGGTEFIDQIELQCQKRAKKAFDLQDTQWGVNVQALSGSPANMAVYTALLNPYDRIMSLDLPHGGHLSHGFQTGGKKVSATSKYFQVLPYFLNEKTGIIDYDNLHRMALIYRPKLVIAGTSAYSRLIDYGKMRQISDQINAYLLADMAHPAGLMAAKLIPSPFEHADVVTTTTHKTLRGPRGALIFYRLGQRVSQSKKQTIKYDLKNKIDTAVFPGLQGGPHNHTIAGIAVALGEVKSPQFKEYQLQVIRNIKIAAEQFQKKQYQIVSGGTDNHLFVLDVRSKGVDGAQLELILNSLGIAINKNTVPGDKKALIPSGIRVGSPAMSTRGCKEVEFKQIVEFVDRAAIACLNVKKKANGNKLKDFKEALKQQQKNDEIEVLRKEVIEFAMQYPIPGGLI